MTEIIKKKFTTQQVYDLFDIFSRDEVIKRIPVARGGAALQPIDISKSFRNPDAVKRQIIDGKKANAFIVIDAGHVMDSFGQERAKTIEQREAEAKALAEKLIMRMNEILSQSSDPLFSRLEAEIVNRELSVVATYFDRGDDGDDWYGMAVLICVHYKK